MFKEIKGFLEDVRYIVNAPHVNIMLLFGLILVVLAFLKLDGLKTFSLTGSPNWIMLIIGVILLFGSPIIFVLTREERRINRKAKIEKGLSFSFNELSVNLKVGEIQNVDLSSKNYAVVLPANTTFIDDCITDEKSALGAFFLKHYSKKIPHEVSKDIERALKNHGYEKNENGSYPPGATIILPKEYDTPAKCILTASTIRRERLGIMAYPSTICECIRRIFELTADKKIEKIYMPVIGSGHGGLDINDALLFILLSLKYYSKQYHHIKSIDILITSKDTSKLKDVYRLQYLTLLEVKK